MKKVSKRPHLSAFLRKWWQLIVMVLAFSSVQAQGDAPRYSAINGYGFKYKRLVTDSILLIPLYASPHTPYRAGALKYRESDSAIYKWTGTQWLKEGGDVSGKLDSVTIHTATDPDPDTLYQWRAGVSELIGLIPKGSGSGTPNTNIIPGYRWLIPSTQEIKGPVSSNTILWDSTSTANALTAKADTSVLATQFDLAQKLDSLHTYTAADPDPDTIYAFKNGDSTLVGYIPKGSGGGSGDTTEVGFPLYISAPVDENDPDTLKILRDSAYMVSHIIQDTVGTNLSPRSTAGSLIEYSNGYLVVGYSFYFGAAIGDQDSAKIAFRRSYDRGGSWTEPNFVTPPGGGKLTYVPSLMLIGDTLHMIAPVVNATVTNSEFYHFKSVDTGKTWNAGVNIDWLPGMKTHGSHRLLKSIKSNRIFYPWAINTPGSGTSSGTGHWEGRLSYSDDNMVTWTMHPTLEVISDDSAVMETEIHEANDSLYYTWRGRTGWMLYIASGDNGDTWTQPAAVNQYTANFGIQKPNSMHSIKQIHNDRLWVAIINPVKDGFINNSADGRRYVQILASTSGKPGTFYPAQSVKFDTTGGRSYGDINICITTDYAYALYYVANRNSTRYQYELTRIPLNKLPYLGITDSLPRLLVKKAPSYYDTTLARITADKSMPAGVNDVGGIDFVTMPRNGAQVLDKFMPGIVGRGYGSGMNTGLVLQGITPTNTVPSTPDNWDGGVFIDAKAANGVLSNLPLFGLTNNHGAPYFKGLANGTAGNIWTSNTALFGGSQVVFSSTYGWQVRNDAASSIAGFYNGNSSTDHSRIDFTKLRGASQPNTNDIIGSLTFNSINNAIRVIANGLTNSTTGGKPVDFLINTVDSSNVSAEALRVTSQRRVGIGTQTPIDKLHVAGTVRITDTLKMPNLILKTLDTTNFKISVVDASGNYFKMHWPSAGGSADNWGTQVVEHNATLTGNGTSGTPLAADTTNYIATKYDLTQISGGGGTPGGANTNVQYNDGGAFGGEATFIYNETNNSIYVDSARALRLQSPLLLGGVATTSGLVYQTTTGVGTTGANHTFLVGNNGADTALIMLNNKNIGVGFSTPTYKFDLRGTIGVNMHLNYNNNDEGLYMANGNGLQYILWNAAYNGSTVTAKATTATGMAFSGAQGIGYANTGLTAGNTFTLTERFRWNQNGFGIGTTGPDRNLDVLHATNPQQRWTNVDGTTYGELFVNSSGNYIWSGSNTSPLMALGGSTSSFPAFLRDGAAIQVRLADNSANANLKVLNQPYNASTWDDNDEVPTKNAVRDLTEGAMTQTLWKDFTITASTGTSEVDLYTYTTPENTLSVDGQFLEYEISGVLDPTSNNGGISKTLRFYWAGTLIHTQVTTLTNFSLYTAIMKVVRVSSSNVRVFITITTGAPGSGSSQTVLNMSNDFATTFSGTNIIKITGQSANASEQMDVRYGVLRKTPN